MEVPGFSGFWADQQDPFIAGYLGYDLRKQIFRSITVEKRRFQRLHTVADNAAPPKTGGSFPDGPGWERTGRKEHCFLHKLQERHFLLRRKAESARYPLENFSDRFLLQRNRYRHIVLFGKGQKSLILFEYLGKIIRLIQCFHKQPLF